jgi:hypothetical protein
MEKNTPHSLIAKKHKTTSSKKPSALSIGTQYPFFALLNTGGGIGKGKEVFAEPIMQLGFGIWIGFEV